MHVLPKLTRLHRAPKMGGSSHIYSICSGDSEPGERVAAMCCGGKCGSHIEPFCWEWCLTFAVRPRWWRTGAACSQERDWRAVRLLWCQQWIWNQGDLVCHSASNVLEDGNICIQYSIRKFEPVLEGCYDREANKVASEYETLSKGALALHRSSFGRFT